MTTLYGIKNCDTVKKARKWLDDNGIEYHFHDFRQDGLDKDKVAHWLEKQPLDKLVNKRSTTWKQLDEKTRSELNETTAPALCAKHETLIKRPVLELGDEVHLGFKAESYKTLFNQ